MAARSVEVGGQYKLSQVANQQTALRSVGGDGDNEATESASAKAQEAGKGVNVNQFPRFSF